MKTTLILFLLMLLFSFQSCVEKKAKTKKSYMLEASDKQLFKMKYCFTI